MKPKGTPPRLVAARDLEQSAARLVPLIASSLNIVDEKKGNAISLTDPSALAGQCNLWITQSWVEPKKHGAQKKKAFMPPFWAVRTTKKESEATCSIAFVRIHGVRTCVTGEDKFSVSVPTLVPVGDIKQGEEFVRHVPKPKDKEKDTKTPKTWLTSARKKVTARVSARKKEKDKKEKKEKKQTKETKGDKFTRKKGKGGKFEEETLF